MQLVQCREVGLGTGNDDVGVGTLAVDNAAVLGQAHGDFALRFGALGDGIDRVQLQLSLALHHTLDRLERGIAEKSANAILIKANQNGLLTSTHRVLYHAHSNNFATVVSARSGETEDSWLADIATGWRAQQIKVGSTHGSERTAKWNRLLELEATEETEFARPFKAL